MAVQPQTPYQEFIANGTTAGFNLGFDCDDQDHLIVLVDDVEPVVGSWALTGGAVVFGAAPASGNKITIQRNTPFERKRDYQSYDNSFRPPAVNKDFDWIWLKLQELGVADWILGNRIAALKNYVDLKDDELRSYLMEEIRKQGVALDQLDEYYNYLMQRLAQIAVDKGWDASFVVDGDENQKQINDKTTQHIATIAALKNYAPRKNSQIVEVIDYDSNAQAVFNKYIYRASSNLDDNYGTVISSNVVAGRWLMIPKAECVPEDFGVASGDFIATNTARITAYLQSGLSLYIPAKTYIAHSTFLSVTISKTTKIIGQSITDSIFEKLQIITRGNCDSSEFKNFRINTLSMNYSIYVNGGNYMNFENIHTYHNYDGICFYNNTGTKLKRNTVRNCISEKSGRVGFAVDIGGEDTVFENLAAIDCKQAYHFEGCKDSKLRNSKAISCGLESSLSSGEQDGYAGPLRSYAVDGLLIDGLENITPVGTSQWQHGGGLNTDAVNSNDLVFKNLVNCGALILDEENAKTRNATFKNIDQLAIYTTGFNQKFTGKVIVENCTAPLSGIDDLMIHGSDTLILSESNFGRMQLAANKIRTQNITAKTSYYHIIEAVDFKATGILENIQTALGDPEWYHGFVFNMTSCVRLVCDTLRLAGIGSGWHLVFDSIGAATKEINLGDLQEDISTAYRINGAAYGNKDVFSDFGIQYHNRRTFRRDAVSVSGIYRVGDMILKNTVTVDTIYGWICTTGGIGAAAVWKPLKYSV